MSDAKLGLRSPLVLQKIGFDLKPVYDDTVQADLPPDWTAMTDELDGCASWREVDPGEKRPPEERAVLPGSLWSDPLF